jgi:hypothetical protein
MSSVTCYDVIDVVIIFPNPNWCSLMTLAQARSWDRDVCRRADMPTKPTPLHVRRPAEHIIFLPYLSSSL